MNSERMSGSVAQLAAAAPGPALWRRRTYAAQPVVGAHIEASLPVSLLRTFSMLEFLSSKGGVAGGKFAPAAAPPSGSR